jgi:hypothetical protein
MPNAEYLEWQEFYSIEPFGLSVQDGFQAHQVMTLMNVNRNPKVRPEPFELGDFLMFPPEKNVAARAEEATVDGLNSDEWKLLQFFQALKARQDKEAKALPDTGGTPC